MRNNTDVIERDQPIRRLREFNHARFLIIIAAILAVVIAAGILTRAIRTKEPGVMEAVHAASLEKWPVETEAVKAPRKFKHVIFRLGDDEIFRFTYDDSGEGMRYSFEVREGGL